MAYTYILECSDSTYYVGSTFDLQRRLTEHSEGSGASYTATRRPIRAVWVAEFASVRDAFQLEQTLHGWSHAKKRALIDGRFTDLPELARCRAGPREQP